jgi:exodeoxyribonuclease VII large subunit
MQGDNTPSEVVKAITSLSQKGCDLIVITRGGGSTADLRWFDHSQIAYEIANCPIPILAAIGHHDDESIAEIICFHREKTPTAAADFILHIFKMNRDRIVEINNLFYQRLSSRIDSFTQQQTTLVSQLRALSGRRVMDLSSQIHTFQITLTNLHHKAITALSERLANLGSALARRGTQFITQSDNTLRTVASSLIRGSDQILNGALTTLKSKINTLDRASMDNIGGNLSSLARLKSQLHIASLQSWQQNYQFHSRLESNLTSLDPHPWMEKGWTLLISERGTLKSTRDAKEGDAVKARLKDGAINLTINSVLGSKDKNPTSFNNPDK